MARRNDGQGFVSHTTGAARHLSFDPDREPCFGCSHDDFDYNRKYYVDDEDEYEQPPLPTAEEIEKIDARDQKIALAILTSIMLVVIVWLYRRCHHTKATRIKQKLQQQQQLRQRQRQKQKQQQQQQQQSQPPQPQRRAHHTNGKSRDKGYMAEQHLPFPNDIPEAAPFQPTNPGKVSDSIYSFGTHLDNMYYEVSTHQEECMQAANCATKLELYLLYLTQQLEGIQNAVTSPPSSSSSDSSTASTQRRYVCKTFSPCFQPEQGSVFNLKQYNAWLSWQNKKADLLANINSVNWDKFIWRTNHIETELSNIDKTMIQAATEISALSLATEDGDDNCTASQGSDRGFQVEGLTGSTATADDQLKIRSQIQESLKSVRSNLLQYKRDSLLRQEYFLETMQRYNESVSETAKKIKAAELALDDLILLTDNWYWKLDPSLAALRSFQTASGSYHSSLREPSISSQMQLQGERTPPVLSGSGDMQPGQVTPTIEAD